MSFISYLGDLPQSPSQTPVNAVTVVSTSLRTAGPQAGMLHAMGAAHHAQTPGEWHPPRKLPRPSS